MRALLVAFIDQEAIFNPADVVFLRSYAIRLLDVSPRILMSELSTKLVVRTLANGATAQLRSIIDDADREEARRIYNELKRIAEDLRVRHKFVEGGTHQKRPKAAVLG